MNPMRYKCIPSLSVEYCFYQGILFLLHMMVDTGLFFPLWSSSKLGDKSPCKRMWTQLWFFFIKKAGNWQMSPWYLQVYMRGIVKTLDAEQGGRLQDGIRERLEHSKRRAEYDVIWRYFMKKTEEFSSITWNVTELRVNHRRESAA